MKRGAKQIGETHHTTQAWHNGAGLAAGRLSLVRPKGRTAARAPASPPLSGLAAGNAAPHRYAMPETLYEKALLDFSAAVQAANKQINK